MEWKIIYVGSPEDSSYDQVLEECLVGPTPIGISKFVLFAPAPDINKIRREDLVGVTVVLITCSYLEQEFIRIGYYVRTEYNEEGVEELPDPFDVAKLYRNMLTDEPRVTRFAVNWSGQSNEPPIEYGVEDEVMAQELAEENENEIELEMVDQQEMEGDEEDGEEDLEGEDDGEEEEDGEGEGEGEGEDEDEDSDDAAEIDLDIDEENSAAEDEDEEDDFGDENINSGVSSHDLPAGSYMMVNEDSVDVGMILNQVNGHLTETSHSAFSNF